MNTEHKKPEESLTKASDFDFSKIFKERTPEEEAAWEARQKAQLEEDREFERKVKIQRGDSLFFNSGVPLRHARKIAQEPQQGPWLDSFKKARETLGGGVILAFMGKRGAGKTHMATALIRHSCSNLKQAVYVKAITVFLTVRKCYKSDGVDELSVIKEFCNPSLLVIDAMEERGETPFEDRILNHIIDARYDALKDTILITNQTPEAFSESVGPSVVSRIHEAGEKIVFDWDSFRKPKAA